MRSIFYPVLVFLVMVAWGVLHSWLASFATKRLARQIFGKRLTRYYRLMFVAVAILTISPVLAMVVFLPAKVLWMIPSPWMYLTLSVQLLAIVGLLVTISHVDVMAFVGLRQLSNPDIESQNELVITGWYQVIRHPLYFFSILILWLMPLMTDLILGFVIASTLYFLIGTIPEEKKLIQIYGQQYQEYQEKVPRIIPGIRF